MERISVVVDTKLLRAVDRFARSQRMSRSAMVREALREYLRRLDQRRKKEHDREGYRRCPQSEEEIRLWEGKAMWEENCGR
jgi:metal-responsive CopG/Arc/MetJ family transcriptional regulator